MEGPSPAAPHVSGLWEGRTEGSQQPWYHPWRRMRRLGHGSSCVLWVRSWQLSALIKLSFIKEPSFCRLLLCIWKCQQQLRILCLPDIRDTRVPTFICFLKNGSQCIKESYNPWKLLPWILCLRILLNLEAYKSFFWGGQGKPKQTSKLNRLPRWELHFLCSWFCENLFVAEE